MSRSKRIALRSLALASLLTCLPVTCLAQVGGAPSTSPMRVNSATPYPATNAPALQNAPSTTPLTQMAPAPPRSTYTSPAPPSVTLGNPGFDPYNSGPTPGVFQPAVPFQQPVAPSSTIPGATTMGSIFGGLSGGTSGYQMTTPPPTITDPALSSPPGYPSSVYPNAGPPVLFPGGLMGDGMGSTPGNYYNPLGEFSMPAAVKFFQGPRFRYGWLGGGDSAQDLDMNEMELSLAFAFPNFLYSGQPVYVLPSFSLDLWDGPSGLNADLPANAYEAFIDTGWQSDPNQILGLETGLRIGVFTDFDTFNSDSLRIMGQLLGKFRLTPRATLKAGVMYVDRNRVQLIPAGGLLWQPTPYSRWDIYFPEPKVSRYFRTVGTQDVWGYVAGEYGGGSWTITRTDGDEESIDINDFRVLLGLEWGRSDLIRSGRRTGFVEAGVVFGREVYYDKNSQDNFDPNTTFIIRAGVGY